NQSQNQTKALYYPSIDLNVNATRNRLNTIDSAFGFTGRSSYTSKGYSLNLRQALYRWDYISQLRQAKASVRQAEAELNQAYQDIILRVAQRYFDVLAARDELEFSQAEKNAISRQLDQAKQRFEVGLIAITDVHEAQAAYDLATASEIVAQNGLATSHQALRELTGELPQQLATLGPQMGLTSPEPSNIEEWVNSALQGNFRLLAAEAATEVAQQGLSQQRAGRHPTLDLVASHNYNDNGGGSFGTLKTEDSRIGLQLNLPIYQGGSISAGIQRANAQLAQAKDTLEQQRRATQREASDAYLSVLAGISQVKALQQAVKSSESALSATEAGYEVGTRTTVDVLNSRRELFRTQRDFARARYNYILASLRLQQAAGMLDIKDVEQINRWMN
ncbi:MAG TPA: type I secretion protein TolC, partial [Candidatus Tenderia electrophaga]|nr:type I secretion protein TolC [Candidatus Tenderia electrophaga]